MSQKSPTRKTRQSSIVSQDECSIVTKRLCGEPHRTGGYYDGSASESRFNGPRCLAYLFCDKEYLFVCDRGNKKIRIIGPDGVSSTFAPPEENDDMMETCVPIPTTSTSNIPVSKIPRLNSPSELTGNFGSSSTTTTTTTTTNSSQQQQQPIPIPIPLPITPSLSIVTRSRSASTSSSSPPVASTFGSVASLYSIQQSSSSQQQQQQQQQQIQIVANSNNSNTNSSPSFAWSFVNNNSTTHSIPNMYQAVGPSSNSISLDDPFGITIGRIDNNNWCLYVTERNTHTIRKISSTGAIEAFCGQFQTADHCDGFGEMALFSCPSGIIADNRRRLLFVCDSNNHCIRKITFDGHVETFCGRPGQAPALTDGRGSTARFHRPESLTLDHEGAFLYIVDSSNGAIRYVEIENRIVTTLIAAHINENLFSPSSLLESSISRPLTTPLMPVLVDSGPAHISSNATGLFGIAVDRNGTLVLSDSSNNCIRKITRRGEVSVIAGRKEVGIGGSEEKFNFPTGVAIHPVSGQVVFSDSLNNVLRQTIGAGIVGWEHDRAKVAVRYFRFNRLLSCSVRPSTMGDRKRSIVRLILDTIMGKMLNSAQIEAIRKLAVERRVPYAFKFTTKESFLRIILSLSIEPTSQTHPKKRQREDNG